MPGPLGDLGAGPGDSGTRQLEALASGSPLGSSGPCASSTILHGQNPSPAPPCPWAAASGDSTTQPLTRGPPSLSKGPTLLQEVTCTQPVDQWKETRELPDEPRLPLSTCQTAMLAPCPDFQGPAFAQEEEETQEAGVHQPPPPGSPGQGPPLQPLLGPPRFPAWGSLHTLRSPARLCWNCSGFMRHRELC